MSSERTELDHSIPRRELIFWVKINIQYAILNVLWKDWRETQASRKAAIHKDTNERTNLNNRAFLTESYILFKIHSVVRRIFSTGHFPPMVINILLLAFCERAFYLSPQAEFGREHQQQLYAFSTKTCQKWCLLKIELKFLFLVGRERNRTRVGGKGSTIDDSVTQLLSRKWQNILETLFCGNTNEVCSKNILWNHLMSARETVRVHFRRNWMGFSLTSTTFNVHFALKIGNRCVVFSIRSAW